MNNLKYVQLSKPHGRAYQTQKTESDSFVPITGRCVYVDTILPSLSVGGFDSVDSMSITFYLSSEITTSTGGGLLSSFTGDYNQILLGAWSSVLRDELITLRTYDSGSGGSLYSTELESIGVGWHTLTIEWDTDSYIVTLDGEDVVMSTYETPYQFTSPCSISGNNYSTYGEIDYLIAELIINEDVNLDFEDYAAGTTGVSVFKNKYDSSNNASYIISDATQIQESDDITCYANIYGYNTDGDELIQADPNSLGFDIYGDALENNPDDTASYNYIMWNMDQVQALSIQRTLDQIQLYNDYLYPLNDNFPLELWEDRYGITPPSTQTTAERTAIIKALMDFPSEQSYPLSLTFLQKKIDDAGFSNVTLAYNGDGAVDGYINANSVSSFENYDTGDDTYNSFVMSGTVSSMEDYERLMLLIMSIKPLDCFVVNKVGYNTVLAIDGTTILAVSDTQALLLTLNNNA